MPEPQAWTGLSPADRDTLWRILNEPVDFVDSPTFHQQAASLTPTSDLIASTRPFCNSAEVVRNGTPDDLLGDGFAAYSSDDEAGIFLRLNYARYCMRQILDGASGRPLTPTEAQKLLALHACAEAARVEIVQSNLPLVLAMAKRARLGNVDYAELISEGNMALLRSADKFDCGRGFRFSTYACRAILKSFSRVVIRTSRYRCRFPTEFDPTLERSDHQDRNRDGVELDCIAELKEILQGNRAELTEIERRVLTARFALDNPTDDRGQPPRPLTLEQVGFLIGVTKERVRQIQNKALAKLRTALEESILAA
ncbi:MAG: sigma-70 family RNA polymerase sigma factor [Phycisphaerae bacterium]|nr:sigma-70 family RNA polymerase sigma factor [Phycisphaerae bacterium]NUQ45423.1 sigma-70 family RNA polymerase sigma factor [Phycisphaerae bacterium]